MKKRMRRFGWIGIFLLGCVVGAVFYRVLQPTENIRVFLHAPQGVRECKMKFSIETEEALGGWVIADGGGVFACGQRSEVAPGLWVACKCLETGGDGS